MKKLTNCQKVFNLLRDEKPHINFSIIDSFGGGNFALAARIRNLKEQGYNIKSGTPQEFGKERTHQGEWWYQLAKPTGETLARQVVALELEIHKKPEQQNFLNPVHQQIIASITLKPLTKEYMRSHSQDIKDILG